MTELPEGGLIPGQVNRLSSNVSHLPKELLEKSKKLNEFIAKHYLRNKSSEWYMEKIMNNDDIQDAINDCMGGKSIMVGK